MFVLWLMLSGYFTPLILGLGIASCALVGWLSHRMALDDREGFPVELLVGAVPYWIWLLKEVFVANLQVARIILAPGLPISPKFFTAPASQKTDLGKVIFANSITLTPGTISVEVKENTILVHTLSADFAWVEQSCEMDARVAALEER